MIRNKCVICENYHFQNVFDIISSIDFVSKEDFSPNEIETLNFIGCINCGCIQLQNLFNADKIYEQPMTCFNGPCLNKHYELFSDFIVKNKLYNNDVIFEIGGSYGRLAKLLINNYKNNNTQIKYCILELFTENYLPIENVEYISGNCETYEFKDVNTIIMSHVFEHLYEPRSFLKKISLSNVKEVFISIPDMESLTRIEDINNLNIYHTFYIDTNFITYLFKEYNYELKNIYNYENNSMFYYFIKEQKTITNMLIKNINLIDSQSKFYYNLKNKINKIKIDIPFYICPSGHYGRVVYYYLNENVKKNVLGFLDSDPMKIDKRLCGTNCFNYKKEKIIMNKNFIVLIVSKKHTIELTDELLSYNDKTTFIYL